jgi:hypothetical protein
MNQDHEIDENEWVIDEKDYHEVESIKRNNQKQNDIVDEGREDNTVAVELVRGSPLFECANKKESETLETEEDKKSVEGADSDGSSDDDDDDDDESLSTNGTSGNSSQFSVDIDTETEETKFVPESNDSYDEFLENLTSSVVIAFVIVVLYKTITFAYQMTVSSFH